MLLTDTRPHKQFSFSILKYLHGLCVVFKFGKMLRCRRNHGTPVADRKRHILQVVEAPFNTLHLSGTPPRCISLHKYA